MRVLSTEGVNAGPTAMSVFAHRVMVNESHNAGAQRQRSASRAHPSQQVIA